MTTPATTHTIKDPDGAATTVTTCDKDVHVLRTDADCRNTHSFYLSWDAADELARILTREKPIRLEIIR